MVAFLLKIIPCAFLSLSFPTGFITLRLTGSPNFFKDIPMSDLAGTSFPDLFVYCVSVNDSFVMNAWADRMQIQNVKMIPDGSGNFTRFM